MIAWVLAAALAAHGHDGGTMTPVVLAHRIDIAADRFTVLGKKQQALWKGHVKARRGTLKLRCEELIAYYTREQDVRRVECVGGFEAEDGQKWAKGDHADFDNLTGVLVGTGTPLVEARDGRNQLQGTRFTFTVGQDALLVEKATTVIDASAPPGQPDGGVRKQVKP